MGTSEEGTGRGMGGGREEASGGGIARGKDGAREQGNETFKGGILSIQYIHTQSRNALLPLLLCYYK